MGYSDYFGDMSESFPTKGSIVTKSEIREQYDNNPNMTIAELARVTGKSRAEIIQILMESK